jgi:hypothetical protein
VTLNRTRADPVADQPAPASLSSECPFMRRAAPSAAPASRASGQTKPASVGSASVARRQPRAAARLVIAGYLALGGAHPRAGTTFRFEYEIRPADPAGKISVAAVPRQLGGFSCAVGAGVISSPPLLRTLPSIGCRRPDRVPMRQERDCPSLFQLSPAAPHRIWVDAEPRDKRGLGLIWVLAEGRPEVGMAIGVRGWYRQDWRW